MVMKFLQIMGRLDCSSFIEFEFDYHQADEVIEGDQIWSNGHCIQIAEYVDKNLLDELIDKVSNKQSFKGALIRMELM